MSDTRALHSCFQIIPSVDWRLIGYTRYAVITVILLLCFPPNVIQLHCPISSDPYLSIRSLSLLVRPVIVPPGLCLMGKSYGDVDSCILAC